MTKTEYTEKLKKAGFTIGPYFGIGTSNVSLNGRQIGQLNNPINPNSVRIYVTNVYPIEAIESRIKAAEILEREGIRYRFESARQLQLELTTEVATKQNLLTKLNSLKILQQ